MKSCENNKSREIFLDELLMINERYTLWKKQPLYIYALQSFLFLPQIFGFYERENPLPDSKYET
jgi:hypothetical protein